PSSSPSAPLPCANIGQVVTVQKLPAYQLDIDLWIELLCTWYWQYCLSRLAYKKRALSVYFPCDCIRHVAGLLDHLIRLEADGWRNRDPERLGSLEVEDELVLHGLLHRQVARLDAFEHLVDVGGGTPPRVHGVRPIRHEAARHHPLSPGVQHGQPVRGGEVCDDL